MSVLTEHELHVIERARDLCDRYEPSDIAARSIIMPELLLIIAKLQGHLEACEGRVKARDNELVEKQVDLAAAIARYDVVERHSATHLLHCRRSAREARSTLTIVQLKLALARDVLSHVKGHDPLREDCHYCTHPPAAFEEDVETVLEKSDRE